MPVRRRARIVSRPPDFQNLPLASTPLRSFRPSHALTSAAKSRADSWPPDPSPPPVHISLEKSVLETWGLWESTKEAWEQSVLPLHIRKWCVAPLSPQYPPDPCKEPALQRAQEEVELLIWMSPAVKEGDSSPAA